ncbi:MAG: LysM peptidoglycan-binding domain-containing protein [Gordonia sp. (in: high G+C Gram-positive bacteria)]|uniref:LysM peptidoglycan-binding domain-containing protein n=1 Tax=Gordonia sp. (in: high G+C Gram-positive bacteria) TaxID=84139 RepID=UPI0039E41A8A
MSDTLNVGDALTSGQSLTSQNGAYTATLQDDGNFVLSAGSDAVWSTKTNGKGAVRATLQDDGNFVLYNAGNEGVWSTRTSGANGRLVLQNDRNLVVYFGDSGAWSSQTATDEVPAAAPAPEPEPAPPAAPPAPAAQTYTVVGGDTLWGISERFLGDGARYMEIAQASGIANPDVINVGQVLTIPAR